MQNLLTCQWRKLALANYIVPPEVVEKYLPAHTKLDFYNGNCFVSLVGFQFKNVEIANIPVPEFSDFEEINLRFYVKRFDGAKWQKGTVFISEIVDKEALSFLAKTFFKENYQTHPTDQEIKETENSLDVKYSWQLNDEWQHLQVKTNKIASSYDADTETEFLLDRPFGYGKVDEKTSNEYSIAHTSWETYLVKEYSIKVDFAKQFGAVFSILTSMVPHSVILAEGSSIDVKGTQQVTS